MTTNQTIKSGIFNLKQFFVASILGGPVMGGYIVAANLWIKQKKGLAILPIIIGLFLGALLRVPVYLSVHNIKSILYRNLLAVALMFILQAIITGLFRYYFIKNKKALALIFSVENIELGQVKNLFSLIIISLIYFVCDFVFQFYLWTFLAFFLIPHFYIYTRISTEFVHSKITKILLGTVVFLGSLTPLVYATGQIAFAIMGGKSIFYTHLNYVIGIYIIFVFYFFLLIIPGQIFRLINSFIHVIPGAYLASRKSKLLNLILLNICALLITVYGFHNNNKLKVNNYHITIPAKESTLKSLKAVCIADLHLKEMTSKKFLRKLVVEVNKLKPDIIVIPGDVIEAYGDVNTKKLKEFSNILRDLSTKYGIYVSYGNHDKRSKMTSNLDFLEHPKTTILRDSLIEVDGKFCVMGLNFRGNHQTRPIDSILQFRSQDLPTLLLDHAPYCLDEAIQNKIDVQFSGHTHNGQVWPLNYIVDALFDNSWGYEKYNETHLFVTCGVQDALMPGRQDVSIPVRTGSSSEILEIDITFERMKTTK